MITYGSACSGIESASLAWEPLGWTAKWFAEIDAFPSAVLAHRWPEVTNIGDMTKLAGKILWGEISAPDVLVAGTPCQAFSVAGLRNGMDDERGQLTLSYMRLCDANDHVRASQGKEAGIIVWENVPGVLSSKDNAFGCFLAGLAGEGSEIEPGRKPAAGKSDKRWRWEGKSGKHIPKWPVSGCVIGPKRAVAWRVLDAQYFGVAQRRRRVFVVASARDGFNPAAVLFESEGVRRDTAPCRKQGEENTGTLESRASAGGFPGTDGAISGHVQAVGIGCADLDGGIARSLRAQPNCTHRADSDNFVIDTFDFQSSSEYGESNVSATLSARDYKSAKDLVVHGTQDPCTSEHTAFALGRNNGGENVLCESVSLRGRDGGSTAELGGNICPALKASQGGGDKPHVLAFAENSRSEVRLENGDGQIAGTLSTGGGKPGQGTPCIETQMRVRRLTPVECERLQGMPDNHTLIPWRGKPAEQCPDGPRYKAIGNSKAVPVVRWIGRQIEAQLSRLNEAAA